MLRAKKSAGVFAGIALIAAPLQSESFRPASNIDPAILIGIGGPVCLSAGGKPADSRLFFKVAAKKNELKPYGQLPSGPGQAPVAVAPPVRPDPPLYDNLGSLSWRISTTRPAAGQYFDQGLRLAYAFNHDEAARAFRAAQKIDPRCAMCYWGEALVLGPNINMPMDPQANAPALAAIERADALKRRASPREKALIDALKARYSSDPRMERPVLDTAYADAMRKVAERYPNDQNIGVLYAESLMNLAPWDYWEAGGARPKGRTAELVATLEKVLKANPEHPGAIHYYIHTVEASTDPKRAEPYAERLGALMPGAGHLVHMPSHIYYRVGRYKDSLAANRQAVAVDRAYLAAQKPTGVYPMAYYPHNVHFVLISAQMAGDGKTVIDAANQLAALVGDDAARTFAIAQPVRVAPYFAHAQFSDPDTILGLAGPGAGLPYVEGLWHYARGVAYAAKGDVDRARAESAAIRALMESGDFENLTTAGIPARDVLEIAANVVQARTAQATGMLDDAVAYFEKAASLEDTLAYMEPPYWYYPVRQSLGAVLLQKGDLDGAEQAFRASLGRAPNNGWSLYGMNQVYRRRGDVQRVAASDSLLAQAWAGDPALLTVERL